MSSEKITNKIIQDAEQDAKTALEQAREDAKAAMREAELAADDQAAALLEKAAADAAESERRALLAASLDARKNTLAKKRELLGAAFSAALEELLGLGGEDYAALMKKLALAASETGRETLRAAKSEFERYEKPYIQKQTMLDYLNAALKQAGKVGELKLGEPADDIRSGFILVGEIADIDCSVETLLADFRAENEQGVAALLFEGEV